MSETVENLILLCFLVVILVEMKMAYNELRRRDDD